MLAFLLSLATLVAAAGTVLTDDPPARLIYRRGRKAWRIDGRLLPFVSGGDGSAGATDTIPDLDSLVTLDDLRIERGRVLDSIRDLIETAAGRPEGERAMTEDELRDHDELIARADKIDEKIAVEMRHEETIRRSADYDRRRRFAPSFSVNVTEAPAHSNHNLDELLFATASEVPAGSISRSSGIFTPSAYRVTNPVDAPVVRRADDTIGHAPRIDEFLVDHQRNIRRFQGLVAEMAIFGLMLDRQAKSLDHGFQVARSHPIYADRWTSILRAMDVDTSAEGGAWVPTGIGATIHEKVRAIGRVRPLFATVQLPTNPWKWPLEGADPTVYRVAEPTADNESKPSASTPGTIAATFDAEIFGARMLFSKTIEADSIVAIMPFAQNKLAVAFASAEENCIINGDTDGSHMDADIGASTTSAVTAWDGLRKKGLAQTSKSGADAMLSSTLLRQTRAEMGKWGLDPASLAYIVGVTSYHRLLADTNLVTVDKFGPSAVILNGQVGAVDGIPVIVSEHVRQDVNASGVQDGITTDRTFALVVNRGEWAIGEREALSVEVDDSIYRETYQRVMVGFMREDFQHIGDAATNDDTAILYNLDLDAD